MLIDQDNQQDPYKLGPVWSVDLRTEATRLAFPQKPALDSLLKLLSHLYSAVLFSEPMASCDVLPSMQTHP